MLTVVTGPPCSGKTTLVRARKRPGDITIDYDDLARALGSPGAHSHGEHVRWVTMAARSAAIAEAIRRHHRGARVWIVDCSPSRARMNQYRLAGATVITLKAEASELHRRADAERPPLWHKLIDDWRPANGSTAQRGVRHPARSPSRRP